MPQSGSDYIQQCRTQGFSDAEIQQALQKAAWLDSDIQAAFAGAKSGKKITARKLSSILLVVAIGLAVVILIAVGILSYLILHK